MPPMVKVGVAGALWSSSMMVTVARCRAPSAAQRACPSATGERLGRLGLGVFGQRDLDQPRPRVAGAEADRRRGRLEVAAGAGRAGCGRSPSRSRCRADPPRRVTRTIGSRSDSFAVNRGSLSASTPAPRGRPEQCAGCTTPHGRLLEPRLAAPLQSMGGQQRRLAMLRVLDEGLRAGLAAAVVDRLRLQTDVHGEQLAGVHGGQRDLQAARPVEPHHTEATRSVVSVAVDVEPVVLPQRDLRVRGRRRAGPPGMLGGPRGTRRRRRRRSRRPPMPRMRGRGSARRRGSARSCRPPGIPRPRDGCWCPHRLQKEVRDRDLQRGVAGALLVGLVLVEVGDPLPFTAPTRTGLAGGACAITEYCAPSALENRLPNAWSRGRKYQYGAWSGRLKTTRPIPTVGSSSLPPTCAPFLTGASPDPGTTLLTDQSRTGLGSFAAPADAANTSERPSATALENTRMRRL